MLLEFICSLKSNHNFFYKNMESLVLFLIFLICNPLTFEVVQRDIKLVLLDIVAVISGLDLSMLDFMCGQ